MRDENQDTPPAVPEAVVAVQGISDRKALKRHFQRLFEQGQPRYSDHYDAKAAPWNLLVEQVPDFVDDWGAAELESVRRGRTRLALVLTFSMPIGTDPGVNEAAVLAVVSKLFARHQRVWVAGEDEGPFVKMLVEFRDEDGRAVSSGPADLRRYRDTYAGELVARGVAAQATTRGSRGLGFGDTRKAYKKQERLAAG